MSIAYGDPQPVFIGAEAVEMRPALLSVVGDQSLDRAGQEQQIKIEKVAGRILAFLQRQTARVSVTQVKAGVPGKDALVAPALAWLKEQRLADAEPGPRNAQHWAALAGTPAEAEQLVPASDDLPF
jgi:hypothetical protein